MAVLKINNKGSDVIKLQLLLNQHLYPNPKLKADGHFGSKTEDAVKRFQAQNNLIVDGIVGNATWKALGITQEAVTPSPAIIESAPWYDIACCELGISEISDSGAHNQRILAYHATTTLGAKTDEIPWCSSFVNWVMNQAGIKGTDNALASSWISWGEKADTPLKGTVTVIKRKNQTADASTGSSTGYHVGFYESSTPTTLTLLGGNQSNQVKMSTFYLRSYDVIAYRQPV